MTHKLRKIESISDFHRVRGLSSPLHPMISLIDYSQVQTLPEHIGERWLMNFYSIGLKRNVGKLRYGQQEYDFDEGLMSFIAPGQILSIEPNTNPKVKPSGWLLLIHPNFLWHTPLATKIKQHEFFGYTIHEALFLSEKEEHTIVGIFNNIQQEYDSTIDAFSQRIIIAQIELLLNYAERFYQRQFITRKISNHQILGELERVLDEYYAGQNLASRGIVTVQYVADALHVSPNYLSSLLKSLTGQSTQQHIHEKLIQKAKEQLSTTDLSVSEIAYALGFEHPQSLSKLFKSKTQLSPVEFRQSFQ
ncbi:AraC family transcriptional regulator [Reichenbachiella sp. 5M10]|uniref:helix-turn-helix domain-containing protein n=1 Tax=Reichenbachiella sp. 5M10 TaxID=1889772 RepID=UPI000C150329|nr:response regulator transcription factor [Reichenbachiella sp. 5M10]PIB34458.1 AraC family transcriptional regulator [Reichenbachiella sp. 5M10]